MKDLTKGKPSRLILAFAIPIFMANILQLTYSIVDTRIVGSYLGENALAAVGATTTLSNLVIGFLMGLSNGFAIITAQKFGARDYAGVKKSFALSLKMGCTIALAITIVCLLFLRQILGFLNVSNDLMGMSVSYIFIIIAGLVATFLYDACAAALRALGDTVTPLVILAVSVCLNMAGDIFFVVVLKAGVAGAAIATVLAQVIAFIVCYVYMVKRYIASYTIGPWLVKLVTDTDNPVVIKNATNYLKFDTLFYYVTAVICIVRNAMQGLGEQITPLVSSSLEMVGKIVIAFTLVPLLGYTGVIVAEPLVWFIMVIPLLVKIYTMPVLGKQSVSVSLRK